MAAWTFNGQVPGPILRATEGDELMLIVDPPAGRPPAHELALVLSGFDLDGDRRNEIYGWNGVAGFYERYPMVPDERTDVVTLAQTERAIVEFRLPRRGRYMFHPHQRHMAEQGAMGVFAAV